MRHLTRSISIILVPFLFSSCATTKNQVDDNSSVKIMAGKPSINCQFKGKVGISKNDIYGPSHQTVQDAQLNQLRNQAVRLGANVVYVTSHKTKYYEHPEYIIADGKMQWELDSHSIQGVAYMCSKNVYSQLPRYQESKISDVRPNDE